MLELATQYGLAGVVALLILKEVFNFINNKRDTKTVSDWRITNLEKQIEKLTISMDERNKLTNKFITQLEALTKSIDVLIDHKR